MIVCVVAMFGGVAVSIVAVSYGVVRMAEAGVTAFDVSPDDDADAEDEEDEG